MIEPIEIMPAIRRLRLTQVGPWADMTLDFGPSLNVITEEGSALGTPTIPNALVRAARSARSPQDGLVCTHSYLGGKVEVEFREPRVDPSAVVAIRQPAADQSTGALMLSLLRACLDATPPNMAIILSDDVTACLDMPAYQEAVGLLNQAMVQVIGVIAHRFRSEDFPTARVFSCAAGRLATIHPPSGG